VAGAAFLDGRDADRLLGAARGFFQRDLEVVAQVGAAIDVRAPAATAAGAAKQVAEDVAEGIGEAALEALRAGACAHRRVDAGVAVAVVGGFLLRVGEHLVGLLGLLEFLFRVLAVRIAVRVVLHGQLAVGLLDLVVASVPIDAEDFVVIPFGHDASLSLVSSKGRAGTGAGSGGARPRRIRQSDDYFLSFTSVNSASTTSASSALPPACWPPAPAPGCAPPSAWAWAYICSPSFCAAIARAWLLASMLSLSPLLMASSASFIAASILPFSSSDSLPPYSVSALRVE